MSKIQKLLNKEDRKIFFYDGSRIMYRYRKKRTRPAPKPAPVEPAAPVIRTLSVNPGVSAQAKIGRYKGGSTTRAYDSSYHLRTKKTSRRKARETRRKTLNKRKPRNRYKQLM